MGLEHGISLRNRSALYLRALLRQEPAVVGIRHHRPAHRTGDLFPYTETTLYKLELYICADPW